MLPRSQPEAQGSRLSKGKLVFQTGLSHEVDGIGPVTAFAKAGLSEELLPGSLLKP